MPEKIKQRLAAIYLDMALKDLPVTSELIIEILLKDRKKIENKKIIGFVFIMNGIQYDQTLSKKASRH